MDLTHRWQTPKRTYLQQVCRDDWRWSWPGTLVLCARLDSQSGTARCDELSCCSHRAFSSCPPHWCPDILNRQGETKREDTGCINSQCFFFLSPTTRGQWSPHFGGNQMSDRKWREASVEKVDIRCCWSCFQKKTVFSRKTYFFFFYYFWPTWYSEPSMFFKSSKLYQAYSLAVGTAELKVLKWPYLKTLTWLFLWLNITLQWFPSPSLGIEKVTLILCFASHRKPLDGRSQQFMWWKAIFWEHSLNCSLLIKNISVAPIGKFNRLFICGCLLM